MNNVSEKIVDIPAIEPISEHFWKTVSYRGRTIRIVKDEDTRESPIANSYVNQVNLPIPKLK